MQKATITIEGAEGDFTEDFLEGLLISILTQMYGTIGGALIDYEITNISRNTITITSS